MLKFMKHKEQICDSIFNEILYTIIHKAIPSFENVFVVITLSQNIEMLQYLIENGKIDESELQKIYENMKRKERLKQHTSKIWEGKDSKWRKMKNFVIIP